MAVSANLVGTVDERGVFSVGGAEPFRREFTLEQVEGEWRISNPADGLIIAEPDFERLYDERAAYFLDPTGQRVVPDPRHLIRGEAQPTALVQRLLEGPSAALAAGVHNPLAGVQLRSAVTVRGQEATVDLTGLATDPAPQLAADLRAAGVDPGPAPAVRSAAWSCGSTARRSTSRACRRSRPSTTGPPSIRTPSPSTGSATT